VAVQFRRYEIVPGQMDAFIEWFPRIAAVREQFGFKIEFAYADRENDEFVWAVSHEGDFDAAFEALSASPERAAAFEGQPNRVTTAHLAMVERVLGPG
jgi:heme-degrading monooxygenase HmoA